MRGAAAAAVLLCTVAVLGSLIAVAEAGEGTVLASDDVGGKNVQDWRLVSGSACGSLCPRRCRALPSCAPSLAADGRLSRRRAPGGRSRASRRKAGGWSPWTRTARRPRASGGSRRPQTSSVATPRVSAPHLLPCSAHCQCPAIWPLRASLPAITPPTMPLLPRALISGPPRPSLSHLTILRVPPKHPPSRGQMPTTAGCNTLLGTSSTRTLVRARACVRKCTCSCVAGHVPHVPVNMRMRVLKRICMCICICEYMYVHMYMRVYVCAYVYASICACTCTCIRICICLYSCLYLSICEGLLKEYQKTTHTLCICICVCVCICICICISTSLCIRIIEIHTHTHTHTHTGEGVMDGYDVMLISTRKKFSVGLKGVFQPPDDSLSGT